MNKRRLSRARVARTYAFLTCLSLHGLVACSQSSESRSDVVARDSSGVTVIEIGGGAIDATPVWTAPPLVTIGATESPEDVQLRRVSGAFFMERCANLHRL